LVGFIRSERSKMLLSASAPLTLHVMELDETDKTALDDYREPIMRLGRLSEVVVEGASSGIYSFKVGNSLFSLQLPTNIDLQNALGRLESRRLKIDSELSKMEARLGNQAFVTKAPATVVEETRLRKAQLEGERNLVEEAIERLRSLLGE